MVRKSLSLIKTEHNALVADVVPLIEAGRAAAARSVNSVMATTYWHVGRVIVEREQRGARRAEYGAAVLSRLAETLTGRFGRGLSRRNIEQMRAFYVAWEKPQTPSALSATPLLPVPWLHDVRHLLAAPTTRIGRAPRT